MKRSPYVVFRRPGINRRTGKTITRYSVRFLDIDGNIVLTKALEATTPGKAAIEAQKLYDSGVGRAGEDVSTLVLSSWTPGSSFLRKRKCSPAYVKTMHDAYRLKLSERLRNISFADLTPGMVEKAMVALIDEGTNPRRVNMARQALTVVARDYARMNRIPNPLADLWKVPETPKVRGILSPAEVGAIIALPDDKIHPRTKLCILLGCLCGLRVGEVRGLLKGDVDRPAGVLRIRHNYIDGEGLKAPKAGSTRTVPAPDIVFDLIDRVKEFAPDDDTEYVIYGDAKGLPFTDRSVLRGFKTVLKTIGIDEVEQKSRVLVFHGLRHTYVSLSRLAGVNDFLIQKLAGHKSSTMMDRYSHADENVIDFADARKRLQDTLDKASGS